MFIAFTSIASVLLIILLLVLWQHFKKQHHKEAPPPLETVPEAAITKAEPALKKPVRTKKKHHTRRADDPPDGQRKINIDHQHDRQRQEIMAAHSDRADLIEPASQRQKQSHGSGMGMPPHPLTSGGPQGTALNLSGDPSVNPEAEVNAGAHPEHTPVPTAELHNQATAQASLGMAPKAPGT